MPRSFFSQRCRSFINSFLIFILILNPALGYGQGSFVFTLPAPGSILLNSPAFTPVLVKGLLVHSDQPLNLDFIVDSGNESADPAMIKAQSLRIAKYFLAAVTVPADQLWVNLSPFEPDRIIPDQLGITLLGADMLAQDYVLKQFTASQIYPENEPGREFWRNIYKAAQEQFGTIDIPVDTFNRVWISPLKAEVYEKNNAVYVTQAKLKVQLDTVENTTTTPQELSRRTGWRICYVRF